MLVFCFRSDTLKKKIIIFIPIWVLLIVCIFIAISFFKQTKTDDFKGLWDIDGYTKYEFDGKGNGKLIIPSNEYIFTYTIKDNIISIDFENEKTIDSEYEYIINKDKLELTHAQEGHKHTLKKVSE